MSPSSIQYLFGDITTQQIIAELTVNSVSMEQKLNDWGSWRGVVRLNTSGVTNAEIIDATTPGNRFVVAMRDNAVLWDGILWTRAYDSQALVLNLTARTYEAYLERQTVDGYTATNREQLNIMVDLWNLLQGNQYRNLHVQVPAATYPLLVPRDLTVNFTELKNFFQVISSIADGANGFDWTVDTIYQNNQFIRQLKLGYPFLGTPNSAGMAFDYPGNILNYWKTDGMSNAGTITLMPGAGEGDAMILGRNVAQDMLDAGFPNYDLIVPRKDIENQDRADDLANQLGNQRRPPLSIIKVVTKGDLDPMFGSYGLGDTASLSIVDERHPSGFTTNVRIIAWSYRPQSDDTVESAELVFEGDELNS